MKHMIGKTISFILMLVLTVNANYIIHFHYDNGEIRQEAVYSSDAVSLDNVGAGDYLVSIGNYSTNVSFSLLRMYDPEDIFINGSKRQAGVSEIISLSKEADEFVVVPEFPPGTILKVEDESGVLLEEPLMIPIILDAEVPIADENASVDCNSDSECGSGFVCSGGVCQRDDERVCVSAFIFPFLLALAFLKNNTKV